ncbi:MAG: ankyrin repeat domain-containing protein [Alphaproteobacteria bacterium]
MEDENKAVNKYKAESIKDKNYRRLFEEITKCGVRDWVIKDGKNVPNLKHREYKSYSRLDFIHLFDFLMKWVSEGKYRKFLSKTKAKERKKNFRDELNERTAGLAEVFRQGRYRNIQSGIVKIGIETAAKSLDVALIHLLAEFLKDCESEDKKIRLLLHSEYEKTIKDFIREAPDLIKQLHSKPSQPPAEVKQARSSEQTIAETRHKIEPTIGKEKWLDPYNFDELPLVRRDDERELLDKFIEADGQFKIWAISGPSGSGKTRLAIQWAYDSPKLKTWDCRVLHKEDRAEPEKWVYWTPDKPTLIIIDYLYGFEEVVLKLMAHRLDPAVPKIRLLLIDHVFSEPLHSDKRWGFSGDGSSHNRNEEYFFKLESLNLEVTEDQETIIKSIIANRTGIDIESSQIEEAHEYLLNTEGAYRPLFAALVADAVNSGKDFEIWNRRELINYYLSGEKRLPWEYEGLGLNGRWASHFIAVATARRGVAYKDLIKVAGNCNSQPKHFGDIKKICQKVITDDNAILLKPFEPDIIGESFFLKYLQYLEDAPEYLGEFRQIFIAGDEDTQTEDAISFIEFIQHLTRNLLNDHLCLKETQELWNTLLDFMHPSNFEDVEPIRWALAAAIIDIIGAIKDKLPNEKLVSLLGQADSAVLYRAQNSSLLYDSVIFSMRHFELTCELTKKIPNFSEEMATLFVRLTESDVDCDTPFIIAIAYGLDEMAKALIDHGADIEETVSGGCQNSLMVASLYGQTEIARYLLNAGANIHITDEEGATALHWASLNNHVGVVRLLLGKDAKIIYASDSDGATALHWASIKGNTGVIEVLIEKDARIIHITDEQGATALHWASTDGHIDVVRLFLEKDRKIIHVATYSGHTALTKASICGHVDVARLLLEKDKKAIHAADLRGFTALHWASVKGHIDVVRLLLEKDTKIINVADKDGATALHWACFYCQVDVARLLLDKDTKIIHVADKDGATALHWVSADNYHIEVVKLLLERKARADVTDNNGQTALSIAREKGQERIVKLLTEHGEKN